MGHVAALGEADISRFASYDWESGGSEFLVNVYLCGPPGRFRSDLGTDPDGDGNLREGEGKEIHQAVGSFGSGTLSAKVKRFFARESRGLLELNFYPVMAPHELLTPSEQFAAGWDAVFADKSFNGLSPPSIDWMTTTMDSMYNDAAAGSLSACDHEPPTDEWINDQFKEVFFFDSSFAQIALSRYRADGSCVNLDVWWDNAADALEQLCDVAESHPGDPRIIDLAGVWARAEVGDLGEMAKWARSQKLDLNFWEPDCEAWAWSTERYLEWVGSLAPVECEHDEQGVFRCGRA